MEDLTPEVLAGLAKDFATSPFGTWLMKQMNDAKDSTLRNGMNSDVSDEQLKAMNFAAGVMYFTDTVDNLAYLADNPNKLASTLKQTR